MARPLPALTFVALLMAAVPVAGQAAPDQPTTESAIRQLHASMQVSADGSHNLRLRALRQLRDPALTPLFERLTHAHHPALQIHGALGLAEASVPPRLDLARLAALDRPIVQAEIIGAAMDSDLITNEQAQQLLAWDDLDLGVKVLLAAPLVQRGRLRADAAFLTEAVDADNLARKGMATLLLVQLGERPIDALTTVDRSSDPRRDGLRAMMLNTARQYDFHRAGPWALQVSTEPGVGRRLGQLALQAALEFGVPEAQAIWRRQFDSARDQPQRTRLAMIALQSAHRQRPELFDALIEREDPLLRALGEAGRGIALGRDVTPIVVKLVGMNRPLVTQWALEHASELADPAAAQRVLLAIVEAASDRPTRHRAQRLAHAIRAVEAMARRDVDSTAALLRPMLADERTSKDQIQAVIVGLMRSEAAGADRVIDGLTPFLHGACNNVAALLIARQGGELSPEELSQLSLLVRGGGVPMTSLRTQAAWLYLKITGQAPTALREVLEAA